jgi:hypothetical protein
MLFPDEVEKKVHLDLQLETTWLIPDQYQELKLVLAILDSETTWNQAIQKPKDFLWRLLRRPAYQHPTLSNEPFRKEYVDARSDTPFQ